MLDTTSSCAQGDLIETLSGPQLTEWQTGRLRQLTNHAYLQVPFYRELWDQAGARTGPASFARRFRALPGDFKA